MDHIKSADKSKLYNVEIKGNKNISDNISSVREEVNLRLKINSGVLGIEPRTLSMLGKWPTTEPHLQLAVFCILLKWFVKRSH